MLRELLDSIVDWVRLVPRGVRWAAAGVLVVIVVLAVVRSAGGGPGRPVGRAQAGVGPAGAVMLRRAGQAVLGVLRTTDGAAAAAISYVAQRNALLTGGTSAETAAQVGGTLAVGGRDIGEDPASIPDRAGAVNTRAMLETRAGQMVWWTVPFGYRVRSYTLGRAVVRVFFGLLDASGVASDGPAAVSTGLQDVTLVWRSGAWRLWGVRNAPDQPTVVAAVGVSARRGVLGAPIPERLIRTRERVGIPLFTFLDGAAPVLVGPPGMGPVADAGAPAGDARVIVAALAQGTARLVARGGMAGGGRLTVHGLVWNSSVPVAYRRTSCPPGAQGRCYLVLFLGAGTEGAPAMIAVSLAGLVVAGTGSGVRVAGFDVPAAVEAQVLGGQVSIASQLDDQKRMYGAAWIRSIRPLRPTMVAVPR